MRRLWIIWGGGDMFNAQPKKNCLNSCERKHLALSETITLGTENVENTRSLRASIVAKLVASLTGTNQTNFEKEYTHTNNMEFPALLRGNLPT
jgi:hypothetical protein